LHDLFDALLNPFGTPAAAAPPIHAGSHACDKTDKVIDQIILGSSGKTPQFEKS
jgi:hypothetical protein